MQSERNTCLIPVSCKFLVFLCFCLFLFGGCNPFAEPKPPSLSGTFRGTTLDGRAVTVTLTQKHNSVTGAGLVGDRPFSFSALPTWHGPLVVNFGEGPAARGSFKLSPDGQTMEIAGLGETFTMTRGGDPLSLTPGPFTGRFGVTSPRPIWVNLTQSDNLLAGTGYDNGKAMAFVGKVIETRRARGTLLFADASQVNVTISLSENHEMLTVQGLGGPINLLRP